MNIAAISLGLCLALLATAAQAQNIGAGARAGVTSDTLQVYATMSESGAVRATLKRGDIVIIGMVLFGSDITWCAISKPGETKRLGYASCEFLEPDRGLTPAAPAPPAAEPKPTVREIPTAPITVREVPPIPAAPPAPVPVPVPPPAPAIPPPAIEGDFVETLLDGMGLRSALSNYTQSTRLLSFLDKGRLAEIDVPALERVLAGHFQSGAFYAAIDDQWRKNYSPERLPALSEWFRSPVAHKLAGLERRAISPEARDGLVAFAAGLTKSPPPEPRLLLIHRLYDSLKTCDMEVEATIALVHTVAQAIGPALPKEKRYSAAELDLALGAVKARYLSIMKNARLVHYLFAYQAASDGELEQYAAFLESDSGKWLISVIDKGFSEATDTISGRLRAEIPRKVKSKRQENRQNTAKGLLP